MKRVIAIILAVLFLLLTSFTKNDTVIIKTNNNGSKVFVSNDLAKVTTLDMETTKQLVDFQNTKLTYDSTFVATFQELVSDISIYSLKSPPISTADKDKCIKSKLIINTICSVLSMILVLLFSLLLTVNFKMWTPSLWAIGLFGGITLILFTKMLLPDIINDIYNYDYNYIREWIELSG